VDRLGNAVVVWEQQSNQQVYAIWASSRSPGGAWTAPTALSNEDHPSAGIGPIADEIPPQLALSDDGTGVAIWPFHLGLLPMDLQASHYVPGQGWDAPVSIGATPADSGVGPPGLGGTGGVGNGPQATIDAKGNAIAVWAEGVQQVDAQAPDYDHQIYARAYTAGAAWGPAVRLSTNGAAIAGTSDTTAASQSPHVAVDPAGDAFVVWNVSGKTSGGAQAIEAVRYDGTAHTWGTPTFIDVCAHCSPAGTSYATTPRVAADAQGNSIVIWNRWTGDGTGIWFSRFTPAGGWSTPVDISDSKNAQNPASTPRIAMDPGGRAVATWLEGPVLRANRYAAGAWGATPATLDQHSIDFIVQPAFDSTGNALLVWANSTDVKLVRFDAASSTFGTTTVIATAIQAGYAQVAARGGGACGGALAVFWAEPAEAGQGIFALGQQ
jgi:hypothetical protein